MNFSQSISTDSEFQRVCAINDWIIIIEIRGIIRILKSIFLSVRNQTYIISRIIRTNPAILLSELIACCVFARCIMQIPCFMSHVLHRMSHVVACRMSHVIAWCRKTSHADVDDEIEMWGCPHKRMTISDGETQQRKRDERLQRPMSLRESRKRFSKKV